MQFLKLHKFAQKNYLCIRPISTINQAAVNTSETSPQPTKSWKEIPGPSSLPFIGELHHFLPGGSMYKLEGYNLQNYLYENYGPIVKLKGHFGGSDLIFLYDAESAAQVLRGENHMPTRTIFFSLEYYRNVIKKQRGNKDKFTGLISDHGEKWKELRSMVNPIMLQPKSIKTYNSTLDAIALEMVARMKSLRDENNMIKNKLSEEINLWTLESTALIALGQRLNCFDPNLPMDSPVRKLLQLTHDLFTAVDELDFKPSLWRYYSTRRFKRAIKIYEELENLNGDFINNAIEEFKTRNTPGNEKGVIEKLIEIDEKIAILIANDLFIAGFDTVTNMIIPIFYLLATNPEKQHKLREELKANTDQRPYLKACVKEGLRLMPVAFGNLRKTSREYNLLGYEIPIDTNIIFCHHHMSLMERHYPKPREYIPERWTVDKDDPFYHGNAHPFAFSVFGYGSRGCIGRRVAELEMETFLARVIENFHIEWFGKPLKVHQSVVIYAVEPFNFIFKDV